MNISIPSAKSPFDSSSSMNTPSLVISQGNASSMKRAEDGLSLGRTILDIYSRRILDCASNQFLDLAIVQCLKTIDTRDLISLLAKAKRLGYSETDVVDDVYETQACTRSSLDATGTLIEPREPRQSENTGKPGHGLSTKVRARL